jgi:hypothetical protein
VAPKWGKESEYEHEFELEYLGNEKERGGSRGDRRERNAAGIAVTPDRG